MPLINVQPMTMQNGDRVTTYTNTVGPTQETFTFLTAQETVILRNKGSKSISYTIGEQSGSLGRSESVKVTGSISSFNLTAESGTQAFEIWADEVGSTSGGGGGSDTALRTEFETFRDSTPLITVLTQAEYDALPATKLTDNRLYLIKG